MPKPKDRAPDRITRALVRAELEHSRARQSRDQDRIKRAEIALAYARHNIEKEKRS